MTDEQAISANHIILSMNRMLNACAGEGSIPGILYVQLDNCWRENKIKNRHLIYPLECLVARRVFEMVEVACLPIGHTHMDIEQTFRTTTQWLDTHEAITREDLHNVLPQFYNEQNVVSSLEEVENWSGQCESKGCLNKKKNITQYHVLRLSRDNAASCSNANEC